MALTWRLPPVGAFGARDPADPGNEKGTGLSADPPATVFL